MPKRKTKGAKKRSKQSGQGAKEVAKAVHKFAKEHKLVSRALGMIPHPAAQAVAAGARQLGYGQQGAGIFSDIGSGLGSLAYGVGGGLGSLAGGLFGRGRQPQLTVVARPGLMQPVLKGL